MFSIDNFLIVYTYILTYLTITIDRRVKHGTVYKTFDVKKMVEFQLHLHLDFFKTFLSPILKIKKIANFLSFFLFKQIF